MLKKYTKSIIVTLFFLTILAIGFTVFKGYGVHWDEIQNQRFGSRWLNYVSTTLSDKEIIKPLFLDQENHGWVHGPFIEVIFSFIHNDILKLKSPRSIILARHLLTFLTFFLGLVFFYLLLRLYFQDYKYCLLAVGLLLLTPRIFAHSFYNSVDIPFLSFYIISAYTLHKLIDKKSIPLAVLHALACAILINIRQIGIILPILTISYILIETLKAKENKAKNAIILVFYFIALLLLVYLFWPLIWYKPHLTLIKAIQKISANSWNLETLYRGNYIKGSDLPWHYPFVWMAITIPISYIIAFVLGLFSLFKNKKMQKYLFFPLTGLFLPIIGVIIFKISIYDGWRHLFFVYPFFIIIALTGLDSLFLMIKKISPESLYKMIIFIIILATIASPLVFMIKYHPYQNLYFNRLAGRDMKQIKENYELDYWGLSYRRALEYILAHDGREKIQVYAANIAGEDNGFILPDKERMRIIFAPSSFFADYFIGNFRWNKEDYYAKDDFYSIKVGNAKIMVVYKLK
ncbi:MAG: glycosyltransferase family 39 protein [Candidatus Omnitrophica bacterium]|nr:glycosyltransferase family 39 protein [Candidatus Omnitrophota bacterium]